MAQVTIRAAPNGPYLVEGDIDLYDTGGSKAKVRSKKSSSGVDTRCS